MTRRLCALFAVVMGLSCSDDPTAPQTSIRVTVSTTGGDLDEDGYEVVVGAGNPIKVGIDASVLVSDVGTGTHVVQLKGIAANCLSTSGQSQSVTVQSGETANVEFTLTCAATGLDVVVRTTGSDFPFGYQLHVADHPSRGVPPNETIRVSRLQPGDYALSLTGIAANCAVAGGSPSVVSVPARTIVSVAVDVVCARTEKRIAFVMDTLASGRLSNWILTSDANGENIVPITRGRDPAWSPDGRILFTTAVCDYYYGTCEGGLEIIDPETRAREALNFGKGGVNPAWSPDGSRFAFIKVGFRNVMYTGKLNAEPVPLDVPINGVHPSWSPDGKGIAYTCQAQPSYGRVCIHREGSEFRVATPDSRTWTFFERPSWSPDGQRIALETNSFNGLTSIALMAPDGSGLTRVTNGGNPSWSPDGSKLIFVRDNGLYTIAPDGSAEFRLTTGRHRSPAWRR